MTVSPFLVYLWGISGKISGVLLVTAILLVIATVIVSVVAACTVDDASEKELHAATSRWAKKLQPAAFAAMLMFALFPDDKTIACMVIVPAILDSKVVQQDVPELYNMAVQALKDSITPQK